MKDVTVLFLVSRLGIGGIQTFVINLANRLVQDFPNIKVAIYCHFPDFVDKGLNVRIDSRVVVYTSIKDKLILKLVNFTTSKLTILNSNLNLKEWIAKRYYLKLVKRLGVDLIHSNISITDKLAIESKKKFGIPFVSTGHGSYDQTLVDDEKNKLMSEMAIHCGTYVYMADKNLNNFNKYGHNKLKKKFIPYGFSSEDVRETRNIINGTVKFCMIARGAEDKGWNELDEAISLLKKKELDFEIHVAADGNLVEELFSNRTDESIYYYGSIVDSLPVIKKCNIGLLPTYHESETMPFTVIEYLYHGRPVISSNIGAIKYMVTNNNQLGGEILELNNWGKISSYELASKMEMYIRNLGLLEIHSKRAYEAFSKFDIRDCSMNYFNLYCSLIH